jgi:hypothetical protein
MCCKVTPPKQPRRSYDGTLRSRDAWRARRRWPRRAWCLVPRWTWCLGCRGGDGLCRGGGPSGTDVLTASLHNHRTKILQAQTRTCASRQQTRPCSRGESQNTCTLGRACLNPNPPGVLVVARSLLTLHHTSHQQRVWAAPGGPASRPSPAKKRMVAAAPAASQPALSKGVPPPSTRSNERADCGGVWGGGGCVAVAMGRHVTKKLDACIPPCHSRVQAARSRLAGRRARRLLALSSPPLYTPGALWKGLTSASRSSLRAPRSRVYAVRLLVGSSSTRDFWWPWMSSTSRRVFGSESRPVVTESSRPLSRPSSRPV